MKKFISCCLVFMISCLLSASPRVIILGFDGVDYDYVVQYMDQGYLPNLSKLSEEGSFFPLLPTIPPQTPVSWSTFTTGLQPGQHMIFDFLKRDPDTYMPSFAIAEETKEPFLFGERNRIYLPVAGFAAGFILLFLLLMIFRIRTLFRCIWGVVLGGILGAAAHHVVAYLPVTLPGVTCNQQGEPFWQVLAGEGYRCKVVRMPVTFPAKPFRHGHLFAGLGVPDMSGRIGKPFFFTSDLFLPVARSNEFSVEVVELPDNQGSMETTIIGPPNKLFAEPLTWLTINITSWNTTLWVCFRFSFHIFTSI